MIEDIRKRLAAKLTAKGVPFKVVLGPEPGEAINYGPTRVVIEYDFDGRDSFAAAKSQHGAAHGPHRFTRAQALKVTIYAQSTRTGALPFEHFRLANDVLTQVLVGMHDVASDKKNRFSPASGRFVRLADEKPDSTISGAKYELSCTFDRAISEAKWDGELRPHAAITSIKSQTKVSGAGPDDDGDPNTIPADADTACGAE
jgi:hypothetical protein